MSSLDLKVKAKLVKQMQTLLSQYQYTTTTKALGSIVEKWYSQKRNLIEMLRKHPYWNEEKFYIAFSHDYEREVDYSGVYDFLNWVYDVFVSVAAKENDGEEEKYRKSLKEQFPTVYKQYEYYNKKVGGSVSFRRFYFEGLLESPFYPSFISKYVDGALLNEEGEEYFKENCPELKAKKGQKISRLINKICKMLHLDNVSGYNKAFAIMADVLNPIKYTRHTIISLNPLDYLLMANGNSWSSCMTTDVFQVKQSGWRGESASGCVAYLLDPSTIIFYTVDSGYNGKELEMQPKINRQLFHFQNDRLLQSRLYPQGCDNSASDNLRTDIRNILQKVISDCLGKPNLWKLEMQTRKYMRYIEKEPYSTHYPDYEYERNKCTLSTLQDTTEKGKILIGSEPICLYCGSIHNLKPTLYCIDCFNDYDNRQVTLYEAEPENDEAEPENDDENYEYFD